MLLYVFQSWLISTKLIVISSVTPKTWMVLITISFQAKNWLKFVPVLLFLRFLRNVLRNSCIWNLVDIHKINKVVCLFPPKGKYSNSATNILGSKGSIFMPRWLRLIRPVEGVTIWINCWKMTKSSAFFRLRAKIHNSTTNIFAPQGDSVRIG